MGTFELDQILNQLTATVDGLNVGESSESSQKPAAAISNQNKDISHLNKTPTSQLPTAQITSSSTNEPQQNKINKPILSTSSITNTNNTNTNPNKSQPINLSKIKSSTSSGISLGASNYKSNLNFGSTSTTSVQLPKTANLLKDALSSKTGSAGLQSLGLTALPSNQRSKTASGASALSIGIPLDITSNSSPINQNYNHSINKSIAAISISPPVSPRSNKSAISTTTNNNLTQPPIIPRKSLNPSPNVPVVANTQISPKSQISQVSINKA